MDGMPGMMISPPPPPPGMSVSPPATPASHDMHSHTGSMEMSYSHMTFFWGKNSEILFSGWPGNRSSMYALALILIFFLTFFLEWLSCRRWRTDRPETRHLTKGGGIETTNGGGEGGADHKENLVVVGLMWTLLHTIRMGLAYIVMLAVMSFNVGVLIMVLIGHAVGFIVFSSGICFKPDNQIGGLGESCDTHH